MISAPWMSDPTVTKVVEALGYPDVDVRFVGGCVRDAVLSRATADIDIATPDLPGTVVEKLIQAGLKAVPTGLSHGTVTAVADSRGFEITTLRKDTACDGRHAAVEFTTDWREDASRRDFTFNAMSLRPDGTVFDPFGGVDDAKAGRVRFVGDPRDRIQEDYLRILRFFRFLAHYGRRPPEPHILGACGDLKSGLDDLSAERVRTELVKLLKADHPLVAVKAMVDSGVLAQIVGTRVDPEPLGRLLKLEHEAGAPPEDWPSRWVALFADQAESLSIRLKCSGKAQARISKIAAAAGRAPAAFEPPALYHFLHDFSAPDAAAGVLIARAGQTTSEDLDWPSLYVQAKGKRSAPFPISGADVRALGVPEGPLIGAILGELEREWVDSGFTLAAKDLRSRLETRVTAAVDPQK